ncbi:hypothetical protein NDU88_005166 [Pleurodeles waltl]|uniref:Uncharacterized protein n=1 Tax=Pleurodeles waltl TaxID=8319 RepID=A0AAV7L3K0_PLEWA|nr:hypothetical protein NDU88_005166 [Pleurodeles waltl]
MGGRTLLSRVSQGRRDRDATVSGITGEAGQGHYCLRYHTGSQDRALLSQVSQGKRDRGTTVSGITGEPGRYGRGYHMGAGQDTTVSGITGDTGQGTTVSGPPESGPSWRYPGGASQQAGTELKPLCLADYAEEGAESQQEQKRQQEDERREPGDDGCVQREEQVENGIEQWDEPGVKRQEERRDKQQEERSEAQRKESRDMDEETEVGSREQRIGAHTQETEGEKKQRSRPRSRRNVATQGTGISWGKGG